MALARETDATLVKPLEGAVIRRFTAGGTIEAGMAVALNSDGKIVATDTTDVTIGMPMGVALGPIDYASGDHVDVVVLGPVVCMTGATPGDVVYCVDSTSVGEFSHTAGSAGEILGMPESASVLFVKTCWYTQSV